MAGPLLERCEPLLLTAPIVALATKTASPDKIKNDLRVDMFARPGPINGTPDK